MNQVGAMMNRAQSKPGKREQMQAMVQGGAEPGQEKGADSGWGDAMVAKAKKQQATRQPMQTTSMQQPVDMQSPFSSSLASGKTMVA